MDEWAQSFKAIHGKTPTKFERAQILEAKNPGLNGEATPRQIFKRSELKPPTKVTTTASSAKVKAMFQKMLVKTGPVRKLFASPIKRLGPASPSKSPKVDYLLKTPSPKKLLRPTNACSNIRALIEDNKENTADLSDEENVEAVPKVFEDEMPDESLKIKTKGLMQRKRKAPTSPQGNFVKANLKHKRYASKPGNANTNRFKKFNKFNKFNKFKRKN